MKPKNISLYLTRGEEKLSKHPVIEYLTFGNEGNPYIWIGDSETPQFCYATMAEDEFIGFARNVLKMNGLSVVKAKKKRKKTNPSST